MKFVKNILGFGNNAEPELDVIVDDMPEVVKEQWSALYITGITTDLNQLKNILKDNLVFKNGIFENILSENNKISVLNAINPGTFSEAPICGVVILVNASSFSEYADILLKEIYNISCKIIRHFPDASLGAKPNQGFSSDEFTNWLKQERDRYFFIE